MNRSLPRWDLTPLFPSLESEKFQEAWNALEAGIQRLEQLFARYEVGARPARPEDREAFWAVVEELNRFLEGLTPVRAYLYGRVATDAEDRAAQAKLSELERLVLDFRKLRPRLVAWLAALDAEAVEAGPYRLLLEEARLEAQHLMSEPEETLAAELSLTGRTAWAKLHGNASSLITVRLEGKELPITAVRNLAYHPDEATRRAAYEAELAAWKAHAVPLAAALNGVKGEASVLNRRRGWRDDLEPTLFRNRISRKALEAMQAAVVASFPVWRRYFRAKAKALGKARLDWWDLFAPVGRQQRRWTWQEAERFIVEQLGRFSPRDADLARRAFRERWIDAEPRKGKRGGAFCMSVGKGESRILANFEESFDSVSTLAHELGHAYHNLNLAQHPPLLRDTPMTLAETASIMNETVIVQAALQALPPEEQLPILETDLQGAAQVVVDIHARFLFESWVFERRATRELSPEEFNELMLEAQRETYGDALATYHPYMWAVKPHYYGTDFYNYPYTFGLLFGLGLYRHYQEAPEGFLERYDALLASTGMHTAQELAARFGIDIEDRRFWEEGLEVLAERVARLEQLVEEG
ncbi:M3 family oligoendopeptidase [Marinithermus hydrothermalis]|uniref:Oligoendopeptidase, pepF/M3 family n=1 Tax=Marinithermus hydrothermalis (strain DSM 14884 / JCM 11576 / T1) TaxID=869210 RepID=F2NKL9_MARHT|nr:M3 family oligoendopeptidase [Marinithermus hydrothermalis]AEB12679.1 oligoendopeptidase, pepF/M3 family [Marinithermus hydrothermalis DSM 14884]